jgi:opacity protein-like surface antigen
MKKLVVVAMLLTSFVVHGYSQDKNIMLIGGDFGGMFSSNNISDLNIVSHYSSSGGFAPTNLIGTYGDNSGDYKTLYLEFKPSILFYLADKLLIGTEFELLNEHNKYESNLITKSVMTSYIISPSVRYLIYQGFFCQLQYNIGKSRQKIFSNHLSIPGETGFYSYDYSTNISGNTFGFSLSAGYSISLGNNITTELAFNYIRNKNKFKYDNISESGDYNIKQNAVLISVGLKYILKQKTNK